MARLEDITPGARIAGLVPGESVSVVQVEWHGTNAVTVTYRDGRGNPRNELLFRDDEERLDVMEEGSAWSFDGDPDRFKLVSEALRIRLAYLFDPYLAISTSRIDPLPHQITAVYGEMLPRQPLRFLLADDPGAGKTIMTGLLIKELIARGDLARCMIVVPGSLVEQWQDELWDRFQLHFEIVTRESIEAARSGNPFAEKDLVIARLDHLSRNEELQAKIAQTEWDLIVADEAHKMSAHYFGNEVKETKRYQLGRKLSQITRHFLLLTATPHSGKEQDFQLFMALLDEDRFEGRFRDGVHTVDISDLMRRLVKEELYRFDGRPLFPERRAYSVEYKLSDEEAALYQEVTDYVREEMNRAERLGEGQGRRRNIVGFALTILQRRLASSPEAIYQSIRRRRERLEKRLREAEMAERADRVNLTPTLPGIDIEDLDDLDELTDNEVEELEEQVVEQASAAATIAELKAEIVTLSHLETLAARVRAAGTDRKWEELRDLLNNEEMMFDSAGARRKLIVFSEHVDTLNYLAERIRNELGRDEAVVVIHGGMGREARRNAQEAFTQDKEVSILIATDAAGEGINLQRAHLLVNYDLPWNPNRIEQRFGRIHRIGQTEVCHMWNLVAIETREGEVFKRLFDKLETQRGRLGGRVFDVLGGIFTDRSLRELLIEAVRYGEAPDVKARLQQVVDNAVDHDLLQVLSERALTTEGMTPADVERVRLEMERAQARRLQPHFIRSFFIEAFTSLGGRITEREAGRYEITHVPADARARDRLIGMGAPLLRRYERVTFEKDLVSVSGKPLAEFVAPGHPLLDATVHLIIERYRSLLKQGSVLIDESEEDVEPRALLYLEHAIQDARVNASGNRRIVSKRFEFVELQEDGDARLAGYAPYLDYRAPTPEEFSLLSDVVKQPWLQSGIEPLGTDFAINEAVPPHLEEVRRHTVDRVERTLDAVNDRLLREINFWDHRAEELKQQELAGKQPRLNSAKARQRADELEARLKRRREELAKEKQLSPLPPVVVGGALIVPVTLLRRLAGESGERVAGHAKETMRVARLAVDAVLESERSLGRHPTEMPWNNPGYDIESVDVDRHVLFIEVKGRVSGAPYFTVTRTEMLTALNSKDHYILALVEVAADDTTAVRYIREPFPGTEDIFFKTTSVNWNWDEFFPNASEPS
jgi:superfamily II DNA or RNA helicase